MRETIISDKIFTKKTLMLLMKVGLKIDMLYMYIAMTHS